MFFIFRISYQGFLCPLFFVFLIKDSYVLYFPYSFQALSLEMIYQSNLKMPENLKNIPKPGEPVVWAAALSHNLAV